MITKWLKLNKSNLYENILTVNVFWIFNPTDMKYNVNPIYGMDI